MDKEHATFTMLEATPVEITSPDLRDEIAHAREPYQLFTVLPFDHDGPFPGKLEVIWLPGHRHITLCWDRLADVSRLRRVHKWWGDGAEEADVLSATDGIEEYLNEHDRFARESHFAHHQPSHDRH
ncbi:MAG TPA: hypothetical protein VGZ29_02125 [Terriglobia bacterium]|nr:hypothetical protein [Terriglobia bacterium]